MSSEYASEFWCNVNKYHDLVKDYERNIEKQIFFYECSGTRKKDRFRFTSEYRGANVQNL